MKRFALILLSSLMCLSMASCSSDDDKDSGTSSSNDYENSAKAACDYLVPRAGLSDFDFKFEPDKANEQQIKKAKDVCVEELNGLPSCKDKYIKSFSCLNAIESGKLSTKAYDDAIKNCTEGDKDCLDKAYQNHPCNESEGEREKCKNDLNDNNKDAANALDKYIEDYRSKYKDL
jgi:hypothetical protein